MNDLIFITIMLVYFGVPLAVFIGGFFDDKQVVRKEGKR